ncbi:MAG: response regulator [Acidobacteria bacterium]|nr:response regulator [Acidobacteriota bacterium]
MARILIIEDNEMDRELLVRRLSKQGHELRLAASGEAGIEMAESAGTDLIVLDLGLPGMDGWEVAAVLRRQSATRAIPILAVTAHARQCDLERALLCGCDEFETKPVSGDRLTAKVNRLLANRLSPVIEGDVET